MQDSPDRGRHRRLSLRPGAHAVRPLGGRSFRPRNRREWRAAARVATAQWGRVVDRALPDRNELPARWVDFFRLKPANPSLGRYCRSVIAESPLLLVNAF